MAVEGKPIVPERVSVRLGGLASRLGYDLAKLGGAIVLHLQFYAGLELSG